MDISIYQTPSDWHWSRSGFQPITRSNRNINIAQQLGVGFPRLSFPPSMRVSNVIIIAMLFYNGGSIKRWNKTEIMHIIVLMSGVKEQVLHCWTLGLASDAGPGANLHLRLVNEVVKPWCEVKRTNITGAQTPDSDSKKLIECASQKIVSLLFLALYRL